MPRIFTASQKNLIRDNSLLLLAPVDTLTNKIDLASVGVC
jgi:hypothetical protein